MSRSREVDAEIAQLRAELLVAQVALADLAAEVARRDRNPDGWLGLWVVRILGFADAAGRGCGQGSAAPRVTKAVERMAGWAESYLRCPANPPPGGI
jgi:hypothetical protein